MSKNKFTIDKPAKSLQELVDFLFSDRSPNHYYRGQVKKYDRNAPSGVRVSLTSNTETECWNLLNTDFFQMRSDQVKAKTDLKGMVLRAFGRTVGNILCQQYGITSDAYDITSDPIIAAFFATRKYPDYAHFSGDSENRLGIIYRLSFGQNQPDTKTIERTMNSMRYVIDDNVSLYFTKILDLRRAMLYGESLEKENLESFIDSHIPGEKAKIDIFRPTVYLSFDTIKRMFVDKANELNMEGDHLEVFNRSRIAKQKAGILYPAYRHSALVAKNLKALPSDNGTLIAEPDVAISIEGANAVFELNLNPKVECFYFKHSPNSKVEGRNEDLWPDFQNDPIFELLIKLADDKCKKYLSDYSISAVDQKIGLIDRGFYSPC